MKIDFYIPQKPAFEVGVRAIFQTHGFPQFENETILPKGNTEIIFDLSETNSIQASMGEGVPSRLPRCFIISYGRVPVYIQLPKQQTYFGLIIDPVAVYSLLGAPAGEFANRPVDLTLVDKSFYELWEQLAEEKEFSARVALITKWVDHQMGEDENKTASCPGHHAQRISLQLFRQTDDRNRSGGYVVLLSSSSFTKTKIDYRPEYRGGAALQEISSLT